jgi:dihydroorotate dehydrogenase (NAD+) catalytic subunit
VTAAEAGFEVSVGSLKLRNPVLVASGTFGSGVEAASFGDLEKIGGVVTKTVTTQPRRGNPPPRIYETTGGLLNSIGLMNPGAEAFIRRVMPAFAELPCARIVNVAGESAEDFTKLVATFDAQDAVDAIEMNVSCPNVTGGLDFGTDAALLEGLVSACRGQTGKPLWVKLTPNVTAIEELARAAARGGADALSLVNTFRGMAVDWRARRPMLGSPTGAGGLSGPAIKPMALHAVHCVSQVVDLPLLGIGGIVCAEDVLEFMVVGATAVQVGTANFRDPAAAAKIAVELRRLVEDEGGAEPTRWIGSLPGPGGDSE